MGSSGQTWLPTHIIMYLSFVADGGGYTISVPIKMRTLVSCSMRNKAMEGCPVPWSRAPLPIPDGYLLMAAGKDGAGGTVGRRGGEEGHTFMPFVE